MSYDKKTRLWKFVVPNLRTLEAFTPNTKFLLYSAQTGSGAQPASYPKDIGGSFSDCKVTGA
jgi:hypothetical protein